MPLVCPSHFQTLAAPPRAPAVGHRDVDSCTDTVVKFRGPTARPAQQSGALAISTVGTRRDTVTHAAECCCCVGAVFLKLKTI